MKEELKKRMVHNSSGKLHPTQKPVDLCSYFIKTYTNEGETVLDMRMGSGTTMISCIETKRNGIGIEKELEHFTNSKNRVAEKRIEKNSN